MSRHFVALISIAFSLVSGIANAQTSHHSKYETEASEVMRDIQQKYYDEKTGLYLHSDTDRHAEFMWGNGIIFSALDGAARHEPLVYQPIMDRFFKSMDRYWDTKVAIPGYEPSPTRGGGHDKYYDDNEWMVLTFTEAYEMTHNPLYLQRAQDTLKFVLSGWDDQLGGGIWWHEGHKGGSKNTCSNAPAAAACLRIAKYLTPQQSKASIAMGLKIVDWTNEHLEAKDGLFIDNQKVDTEKKNGGKLTYNTALMIRSNLALYRWTGDQKYLQEAKKSSVAADWFMDKSINAYRDSIKWSHLQVEADLEMYRTTHEDYLIVRAKANADHEYEKWKTKPPAEVIDVASIARLLWLMADMETDAGKQFWAKADRVTK